MHDAFDVKFTFVLKALSITRAQVAVELRVDKSLIGRWATGKAIPSAHNLSRLTGFVAERTGKFSMLDWERELPDLARLIGVDTEIGLAGLLLPSASPATSAAGPLATLMADSLPGIARRGSAYAGFFRNTRPCYDFPGKFLVDYVMTWIEDDGIHCLTRCIGNIFVDARILPLHSQVYIVGVEKLSRLPMFCIVNGVNGSRADRYEGILLYSALDPAYTPVASPFLAERVAELSGNQTADEAFFAELGKGAGFAPEGSVPPDIAAHLQRDVGPMAHAAGGDLMLHMPLSRSMTRSALPF